MTLNKVFCFFIASIAFTDIANGDTSFATYVYQNKQFEKNPNCETLGIPLSPYFVLNTDLSNTNNFLRKGSFVDYKKNKVIRSWDLQKEAQLNLAINDSFLDEASLWKIRILSTSADIPQLSLTQKILQPYKEKDRYVVHRCCTGKTCNIYPLFKVYENQTWIGNLAFHPKDSSFLNSYSLIKGSTSLIQTAKKSFPLQTPSQSATMPEQETPKVVEGLSNTASDSTQQYIVCTKSDPLKIYDDSLNQILYRIQRFQAIYVFQNWEGTREEKKVGRTTYLKVQAKNAQGEGITGWAAAVYIKKPAECNGFGLVGSPDGETLIEGSTIVVDTNPGEFRFPTEQKPTSPYTHGSGRRYFGAGRSGRKHAACDLLRPEGEKVFAVANGTVLQKYRFYAGTYAIEVKHDSGHVVRYGEVSAKSVPKSAKGEPVVKGQHIGYISNLRMLHFEMYSGKGTGPLTVRGKNQYSRRSDLIDPTSYLLSWEETTF
ncbi:M23 family metallopeptidase [bacterium]|nr:M23 family metallopeptidase [bacterium]